MRANLERLAVAAGKGDREAFGELVGHLQTPVWRFAYYLTRSREIADEATQETWLRAMRSLSGFRGDSSVLTWLLAIARRVIAGLLEAERRPRPAVPESAPWASTALVEVQLELARLPQALQEALVLTQVVGLTYEETARVAGVKIGTVRSRVFRARAALTRALAGDADEEGVTDEL